MSSTPQHLEAQRHSPSISYSSSVSSELSSSRTHSLGLSEMQNVGGGRRRERPYSQSDTALLSGLDRTLDSTSDINYNIGQQYGGRGEEDRSRASHGAVASHFLAQPNDAYGGQTWMDFLRESGAGASANALAPSQSNTSLPTDTGDHDAAPLRYNLPDRHSSLSRPSEASTATSRSSTERKRRLTTAESPLRRPSTLRAAGSGGPLLSQRGGSSSDPIVLDGPSPSRASHRPSPSLPTHPLRSGSNFSNFSNFSHERRESRRFSDIMPPVWQPDSEVSHCPVCGTQFSFFHRKHHCRKCGRVVCNTCSPHRITIPRQFIVRAPSEEPAGISISEFSGHDPPEDDNMDHNSPSGLRSNPALGGGEEVRVCNPCVPDPNYSPPPQYPQTLPARPPRNGVHSAAHARAPPQYPHNLPARPVDRVPGAAHAQAPPQYPHNLPARPPGNRVLSAAYAQAQVRAQMTGPYLHHGPVPAPPGHRPSLSTPNSRSHQEVFPLDMDDAPPAPAAAPTRRQIREEDECPVCGEELPALGAYGNDGQRVAHVNNCIAIHSNSPPPANVSTPTSTSLPAQRSRGMSSAARNLNARGLFPYIASENDCVDEAGGQAECPICMEDLETGARMARLVCWCKFHEDCIRKWWEKRGRGSCPTHQVNEAS